MLATESELLFAKEREDGMLESDHRSDERVDEDEQSELTSVGAQAQADHVWCYASGATAFAR